MPLREPMPVLLFGEPMVLRLAPIQGKPVAQLAGADSRHFEKAWCLQGQCAPWVALGIGINPENTG